MSASGEIPNHRACASCRNQKVRCIPDESSRESCQRCARQQRPCIVTPLQKRKQRKRTDTRVAELEREMKSMRAALKQKETGAGAEASPRTSSPSNANEGSQAQPLGLWYKNFQPDAPRLSQVANWERGPENPPRQPPRTGPSLWPYVFTNKPLDQNTEDVVDRGLISMATARQLFETYRRDLFPHYPLVVVPDSVTADEMRKTKPALFLAVIAAAAGMESSDLSASLDHEVLQAYATRSLINSEKSLELVQALLISAVWYHPPTKFGQLKYYEYIHMAATMAMDIGIGSRPTSRRTPLQQRTLPPSKTIHPAEDVSNPDLSMAPRSRPESPDTSSIESRRTYLACYVICGGVSLSLRRPHTLRVTSWIRESIDVLEHSSEALSSDAILVCWARLIIVAEEISTSFSYDDIGGLAKISELRTQLMMRDFEKRLSAWNDDVPEAGIKNGSLMIMYYTIRLYLFEIALHADHSPEDFRAPYQMGGIQTLNDTDEIPTQVLAEAIAQSISSSHSLLNTFLAMDVESCRALPVFSFVRISFSAFVLAKLSLSAAHPRSRIGKVLDRSSLKSEPYLDRAILHVRNIVGEKKTRVPSIFLALLFKLRQWSMNPEIIEADIAWEPRSALNDDIRDQVPHAAIELNGRPRITEHLSSAESSPKTRGSDSQQVRAVGSSALRNAASMTGSNNEGNRHVSFATEDNSVARTNNDVGTNEWTLNQFDIDNTLMQFLGDANAFSEGGLTGLDDWGAMPMDFTGMDMTGWTMPTMPMNGTGNGM